MTHEHDLIALSVRQPFAELIVTGRKKREFRGTPTNRRGLVSVYSCKAFGRAGDYEEYGFDTDDLQHGMVIGTVEIADCQKIGNGRYAWLLENPTKLRTPVPIRARPQPTFFYPFGGKADLRQKQRLFSLAANESAESEFYRNIDLGHARTTAASCHPFPHQSEALRKLRL